MRTFTLLLGLALAVSTGSVWLISHAQKGSAPAAARASRQPQNPFPDFGYLPPPSQYSGPVFKLSQNYPTAVPRVPLPDFFKTDFKKDWHAYMLQVRNYCFEGNTGVDWRVEQNTVRDWYHMPWQHYGPFGREGIHGLTKEAPIAAQQLAIAQTYATGVTWAVGFFNERGGYTIGQVWKDHDNPNLKVTTRDRNGHGGFLVGTVICKLLLISIPSDIVQQQVPSLVNPIQWQAYITPTFSSSDRAIQTVTLIQMDIAVRDD